MQTQFSLYAADIIVRHLLITSDGLTFVRDEEGASLREYLERQDVSALFVNQDNEPLRKYGTFSVMNSDELNQILSSKEEAKTMPFVDIFWHDQNLRLAWIPLQNAQNSQGYIIFGKSLSRFYSTWNVMLNGMLILLGISLLASFFVGLSLAKLALAPLHKIVRVIQNTDLNSVKDRVPIVGHPKDDVSILATAINALFGRIEASSQSQKAFIAHASHELKTPLARVSSSLDVLSLRNSHLSSDLLEIQKEVMNMSNLIDQLLLLSKIDFKAKPLAGATEIIDFHALMAELKKEIIHSYASKKVEIIYKSERLIQGPIPLAYLRLIFLNVFDNACKYSNRPTCKIIVTTVTTSYAWSIIISDNGPGMSASELQHAKDRFFRGRSSAMSVTGHGLGLALIYEICKHYDVDLGLNNADTGGLQVILTFPPDYTGKTLS